MPEFTRLLVEAPEGALYSSKGKIMKYTVSANVCDGNDYIGHWEVGPFDDLDTAIKVYETWWPPEDEVAKVVRDARSEFDYDELDFDLQVGVWDENGDDYEFESYGLREDGTW